MQKVILIGGAAGQGTGKTAYLFGKALVRAGLYVFNYRDYPSLIRGGHNFNILKVSDQPIASHEEQYDLIVALDQQTITLHQKNLKKDGLILCDENIVVDKAVKFATAKILSEIQAPAVMANNLFLGAIFKMLGLPLETLITVFSEEFPSKKEISTISLQKGYSLVEDSYEGDFRPGPKVRYFLTGNEAIAAGAATAGLTHYFAYPMTPATSVFTYLEANQKELGVKAVQLENEIAVANATIGASFAGGVSMCGSSGGGFDLMVEALSLAGMAEAPLVVYLAQRGGPSTGIPTYSAQADLKFTLNAGHGEFIRLVAAPGDAQEAFEVVQQMILLTQKYRVLGIILGDKHMGEDHFTADSLTKMDIAADLDNDYKNYKDYKSYRLTESGVSPVMLPGSGAIVRGTSYEHDETGLTVEDEVWPVRMTDKRLGKMKLIEQEVSKLKPVSVFGKGKNLLIGWGSTKGAAVDALAGLPDWRYLQVSWINPFPASQVKAEIENADKIILIEGNATGQLGDVIAEKTGTQIKDKILKYSGRVFTPGEIVETIKNFQFSSTKYQ